jgi:hypothetical protein
MHWLMQMELRVLDWDRYIKVAGYCFSNT